MTSLRWSLMLSTSVCFAVGFACTDTSTSSSNGSVNGGSSRSTCDVSCQDALVGYGLDDTVWLLWNENFAGQPSGAQNRSVSCPLGGSAQITGTTGVASNGINTVHLTLDLAACEHSNSSYSLAFSGIVTWDGSFSSTSPNALTMKSSALTIEGSVLRYDMPNVLETCTVSLTDTYNKASSSTAVWLNGEICKRGVSE